VVVAIPFSTQNNDINSAAIVSQITHFSVSFFQVSSVLIICLFLEI